MQFKQITELSQDKFKELEACIKDYSQTCGVEKYGINPEGFYKQMVNAIGDRLIFKNQSSAHFWMATNDTNEIVGFALTHFEISLDYQLTFWQTDGWVRKDLRNTASVREWLDTMRQYAIVSGAKHLMMPCSRAARAWSKFLDNRMKKFTTILKEDF